MTTLRLPQIDLAALLAHQNPNIDLRTDAYEASTRNFLKALTSYKNRAMTTIAERRKHQAAEKKKLVDRTAAVEAETVQCRVKEAELVTQLEREKEERKDAELEMAGIRRQLNTLNEKFASIQSEIEHYRGVSQGLRREKTHEKSILTNNASMFFPQLRSCEEHLSCVIEGVDQDRLLVRFFNLDPSDPSREASFVLYIASENYKVSTSTPHLSSMPLLVGQLNETMEVFEFIRAVREGFQTLFSA